MKASEASLKAHKAPSMQNHHPPESAMSMMSDYPPDLPKHQTHGRKLARWLAKSFPRLYLGGAMTPELLDRGWQYFEHVTLERFMDADESAKTVPKPTSLTARIAGKIYKGERKMSSAEPGERGFPTKLYPIFTTPLSQLGDFGLGVGLYFTTVRDLSLLTFLGGLVMIPNLLYFAGDDYATDQAALTGFQRGSAICTDRTWVPCPTCTQDSYTSGAYQVKRFLEGWEAIPTDGGEGIFLNVTEYLQWQDVHKVPWTEDLSPETVAPLDQLLGNSIPEEYNILLDKFDGYILDGFNVTAKLGYTPLWCGMSGAPGDNAHCYLDMYPIEVGKFHPDFQRSSLATTRFADVDLVFGRFALRNNCQGATTATGITNYASWIVLVLGAIYMWVRTRRAEIDFDEDEQTAQDYSIRVRNPPPDAYDPTEWKEFFESALKEDSHGGPQNHAVAVCTVDVDNAQVTGCLIHRRDIVRGLELALPPETPLDREHLAQAVEEHASGVCGNSVKSLYQQLLDVEEKIKTHFAQESRRPPTSDVFVTFHAEAAQRRVLRQTDISARNAQNNIARGVPPQYLFRGKHVLEIEEPEEPSTIRWRELNVSTVSIALRLVLTSAITVVFMVGAYVTVVFCYQAGLLQLPQILTALYTSLFPLVAIELMALELHANETSRQFWLFIKIVCYNIGVTVVLLGLITPFEATLDPRQGKALGLIPAIESQFYSQIIITPVLQILDIGGHVHRHLLAPRARTQAEMNMYMRGTVIYLADRYANMYKFLFMTLWYSSIYPGALFLGWLAFLVIYFVDRFSYMRSWARSPQVGTQMADFARNFFTPLAVCLMSVASAYFWSGFPYDNLCVDVNATLPSHYYDNDWALAIEGKPSYIFGFQIGGVSPDIHIDGISVQSGDNVYKSCNQDIRSYIGPSFPALPVWQPAGAEWMTMEQEGVVSLHGWTSLVAVALMVVSVLVLLYSVFRSYFFSGNYSSRGEDQLIPFGEVDAIDSYIPQETTNLQEYPLLLCNIDDVDPELFNWNDNKRPHSYYDVTKDVAEILGTSDYPDVFAHVQHWPQEKRVKVQYNYGDFIDVVDEVFV